MLMNNVDWIIVAVVASSAAISLLRGFVREALSLGVWVLALVVSRVLVYNFRFYLSIVLF